MLNTVKTRKIAIDLLTKAGLSFPCNSFFESKLDYGLSGLLARNFIEAMRNIPAKERDAYLCIRLGQMLCFGCCITTEQLSRGEATLDAEFTEFLHPVFDHITGAGQPAIFAEVFGDIIGDNSNRIITSLTLSFLRKVKEECSSSFDSVEDMEHLFKRAYDIGATIAMSSPIANAVKDNILYAFYRF